MNKNTKRMNFDIPVELHKKVKVFAAENNITIKTWILRLIFKEAEFIKSCRKKED